MVRHPFANSLILVLFVLSFAGCEISEFDDRSPAVYGAVVDETGSPISDVHVHVRLHFDPPEAFPIEDEWARTFRFNIPQSDSIQIDVLRYGTGEHVLSLLEGFARAGQYNLNITPYTLTTGLYEVHYVSRDTTLIQIIPVHASNEYLTQTDAFIRSNKAGAFEIDYASLGLGEPVSRLPGPDSTPVAVVEPRITLVLIKEGFAIAERELSIDESMVVDEAFRLAPLADN